MTSCSYTQLRTGFSLPKTYRILRPSLFRRVYDQGFRIPGPYFVAFCLRRQDGAGWPGVGFTTPKSLGKAAVRNRIRRRIREAVRLNLGRLESPWMVVFNPRGTVLDAPFPKLVEEVQRVFLRCNRSL